MAANANGKKLVTQQSVNQVVKAICDIMRRSNCAGALQYVPELTWILFLRILDEREEQEADEARAVGIEYKPSLTTPYRWRDWAAPDGAKRAELQSGALSLIHISEPTRLGMISYAVFCLKKQKAP